MASPSSSSPLTVENNQIPSTLDRKVVQLTDWWLVKSENEFNGKRLAVSGYTSDGPHSMLFFTSSPIVTRYDVFTLGTADGITVLLHGSSNRLRSLQNCIPSQVCDQFVLGFPFYWEDYTSEVAGATPSKVIMFTQMESKDDCMEKLLQGSKSRKRQTENKKNPEDSSRDIRLRSLRSCRMKDNSFKDVLAPVDSDVMNDTPSEVKKVVGTSPISSKGFSSSTSNLKNNEKVNSSATSKAANLAISFSKDNDHSVSGRIEEKSSHECLPGVETEGVKNGDLSIAPDVENHDKLGTGNCSYNTVEANTVRLDLVDDLKSVSGGEKSLGNTPVALQKTRKSKLKFISDVTLPLTRNKRKMVSCVSPEYSNCKRSKSGRLLVPPLHFWRNEQIVYDMVCEPFLSFPLIYEGAIIGVPTGLTSHTGSKSVPSRKRKKHV